MKGIAQPHKNGFFYLLDRTNGRFIYAKPFVERMNWARGVDPRTGWPVVNPESFPTQEGTVLKTETPYERGRLYMGGRYVKTPERAYGHIDAVDVQTGEMRWRAYTRYPVWSGLVTTGGDLVFYGDLEGDFVALDARTGESCGGSTQAQGSTLPLSRTPLRENSTWPSLRGLGLGSPETVPRN